MNRKRASEIPIDTLKEYLEHEKLTLAHLALAEKDYDSLEILFDAMKNPYIILDKAFELLDTKAVEIIINKGALKAQNRIDSKHLH